MDYKFEIDRKQYPKRMLEILNFNLRLSEFELDIISLLLENGITTVDTKARELIRKELNKDKFNTNNYINRLKDKEVLLKSGNRTLKINPALIGILKDKKVSFEFVTHDSNDDI